MTSSTVTALPSLPEDAPNRTVLDLIKNYVDVPKNAVDWKLLGQAGQITTHGKTPDGRDFQYLKPEFTDALRALDGKDVILKGFMFPLDEGEKQTLFLLGPFPVNCPFHYHVGPSLVVEVHADRDPVAFSYDPIILRGRLQLAQKDGTDGVFYRLIDARKSAYIK